MPTLSVKLCLSFCRCIQINEWESIPWSKKANKVLLQTTSKDDEKVWLLKMEKDKETRDGLTLLHSTVVVAVFKRAYFSSN